MCNTTILYIQLLSDEVRDRQVWTLPQRKLNFSPSLPLGWLEGKSCCLCLGAEEPLCHWPYNI